MQIMRPLCGRSICRSLHDSISHKKVEPRKRKFKKKHRSNVVQLLKLMYPIGL